MEQTQERVEVHETGGRPPGFDRAGLAASFSCICGVMAMVLGFAVLVGALWCQLFGLSVWDEPAVPLTGGVAATLAALAAALDLLSRELDRADGGYLDDPDVIDLRDDPGPA